jgi:hypothetical protein
MGRCYEFGVLIHEGCEHAMTVAPEGGHCVCAECGTTCPGRFSGCAQIVSQPGYVPLLAPRLGRSDTAAAAPPPEDAPLGVGVQRVPARAADAAAGDARDADIVPIDEEQLRRLVEAPERLMERLDGLGEQFKERDTELGTAFERFTDGLHRLADEMAADRQAQERLLEAVEKLSEQVDTVESTVTRPIFPKFRRSS